MSINKHREVLKQSTMFMGYVGFYRGQEDYTDTPCEVRIPEDLWRDMGAPALVTLTVEPGDKLNRGK